MAIIDCITFNGEYDLFDIRYNILKDYVDEFIVVEFDKTFSGKDKSLYFKEVANKYPKEKVSYFYPLKGENNKWWIQRNGQVWSFILSPDKYKDLALSSSNTNYGKSANHWVREFCQKESIKDCLIHLKDDDIVIISDVDEIWDYRWLKYFKESVIPVKLKLKVYVYYLNNRSNEEFWGTIVGKYFDIKNECLNHLRVNSKKVGIEGFGWHFTSLKDGLKRKLEDSYTKETYANDWVMDNLEKNIEENKDFLGRDFKYQLDEIQWPQYLKDNRDKYKHLCKN